MRVGELVNLDRSDIDFNERECVVLGKGDKERIVYFDVRTKIHLIKYLNKRVDKNPTLATAAIDKGMPIEQVQRLLGHEKIDTTLRYAQVKQSNVKSAHKK